ncbi:SCAN domain-containing protein 3-like, partial [Vigna radiata var. radiata]
MATANVNFELFLRSFINEDSEKNQLHVIPREQYSDLINEVKAARSARNKTPQQKRRVRRFNVIEIGGIEKLVKATGTDDIVYFVPLEEVYGTIEATHAAIGHGGRDRLKAELGRKYANITRPMIEKFLGMCEVCAGKKTKRKRGLVTKPILHKQLNSRCQVDLVDMQSQEIQGKRFILNYQDHLTKFIQLRALSHKTAEEVAAHLKDIFLTFGAPCILHSDNGREFVNNIIKCMKIHWPELQLVNGKPRHSQSQGSIERANQDVENMLAAWLIDKKTNQWPDALPFIQFMKNRAYHAGIRMSPYEALFGMKPRVGLTTSSLTPDMLANVETEEQLEELLASSQVNEENDEENDENEP